MATLHELKAARAALLWSMSCALDDVKVRGVPKWLAYGVAAPLLFISLTLCGVCFAVYHTGRVLLSCVVAVCLSFGWLAWDIPVCVGWLCWQFAKRVSEKKS